MLLPNRPSQVRSLATGTQPSSCARVRLGPAGIHVFDRSTGTNLLIDEAHIAPERWATAPRNVSVALTNACDLRCPHCYAPKTPATLDMEALYQWLDELNHHYCLGVGFGGGEPTLCRELPALCRFLTEHTSMAATFTTHGHRLDERLAAALSGNVHFIRVSMDGVGAMYERLRGRSFPALLRRMDLIRSIAPFGVNFVVNAQTVADLSDAVSIAADYGAQEFLLLPELPVNGRGGIDHNTSVALRRWVRSYNGSLRLATSEFCSAGLSTNDPLTDERGLRAYAHIDASGVLKRSSYDQIGVPIGSRNLSETLRLLNSLTGGSA